MLYFFIFGIFTLMVLTYQDIKKMRVDARTNYLMHGLALSLITHYSYNILMVLGLILGFYIIKPYLSKYIGKGDLTALHWIIYGTFIISPIVTGIFSLVFSMVTVLYGLIKLFFFGKFNYETPFYPVILSSFTITGIIYFLLFI